MGNMLFNVALKRASIWRCRLKYQHKSALLSEMSFCVWKSDVIDIAHASAAPHQIIRQ
jgi:hypothetical protein